MARKSSLLLAVAFGLFAPTGECDAQVGYGSRSSLVTSGGRFNVAPITTHGNRYVRMGINVGVSELIDVQTFSPVRDYPGLMPVAPAGFGFGGVRGVNPGFRPRSKPSVNKFLEATRQFDKDKDGELNRDELKKVASAVVAELKRSPGVNLAKLAPSRRGKKKLTDKEVTEAFLKQCLKFDQDLDNALDKKEAERMAVALIRALG